MSRSVAVALAYVMYKEGTSPGTAYRSLKKVHRKARYFLRAEINNENDNNHSLTIIEPAHMPSSEKKQRKVFLVPRT